MRKRGSPQVIDLLNSVRIADVKLFNVDLLASRVIHSDHKTYPHDALHIFAENANAKQHNFDRLQSIKRRLYSIAEVDKLPTAVSAQKINQVLNRNLSETGGLASMLDIKVNARIILTVNVGLQDRLINGQLGTVKYFSTDMKGNILKVYAKFDDCKAGLRKMNSHDFGKQHS